MLTRFRFSLIAAFAFGLLTVCLPVLFFAQAKILPVKTYTAADGLPRDAVYKVRQDARGFLWFCTSEGLVRFDGYGFKLYSEEEGLPSRRVNDFLQARNGEYWIGTSAGLVRFNPNGVAGKPMNLAQAMFTEISYETPPPTPQAKTVNEIYEDPQGMIWVGMVDGLYQLIEKQSQPILRRIDLPFQNNMGYLPVRGIFKDRQNVLWISTEQGQNETYSTIYRLMPDGKLERHKIQSGTAAKFVQTLDGTIWAGLSGVVDGGLCQLVAQPQEGRELFSRCFREKDGLPSNWIYSMYRTSDDTIWLGTADGAASFSLDSARNQPRVQVYREAEGVCERTIFDINEDRDGNLWFSTDCGVTKFIRNGFVRYTKADGLAGMFIMAVLNDQAGRLIAVSNDKRDMVLNLFDGRRFEPIEPNTPPGTDHGWAMGQIIVNSRAGDWWFPTEAGVLYRFRGITDTRQLSRATPQAYTVKEGFTDKMVSRLYEDVRGDVWISTSYLDKFLRWDHQTDKIIQLSAMSDKPNLAPRPSAYVEDAEGTLWMGSGINQGYLLRYRNGSLKIFGREDGLPPDEALHHLLIDSKGRLWFATFSNGLGRIDDLKSETLKIVWYNRGNGLSTNSPESLEEDKYGRIYIGTRRGVDCLTPETGQVRSFTTADGLQKGTIYVSARDAQGALWFGNPVGVARYVPEPPRPNQPPTIFLTGLRVAGVPQQVSEIGDLALPELKLDPSQTNVTIDFLSPSATADPHIRYQHMLEGRDDWSAPTEQRTVDFANLSAGSYRFLVRAVNADGIFSATPASFSFTVASPVWQRWWFILLTVGAIGGLAYTAYRYRVAQLLALERMRTRIATDLHDEVGSSLSQIAILSEVARLRLTSDGETPKDTATISGAMEPMEKVAVTSREAVDAMSDIVWAINPQRDQLSDLSQRMRLFASDTLTARDISLRFHAPEQDLSLDAEVRRQVFLLFKEAINNIVRHADCTEVEIDFVLTDHHLSLRVWDNGHGFVETNPQPGQNGGNGLLSMRRRAMGLGGKLEIISGNGDGTTVKLEAPLSPRKWQKVTT